MRDRLLWWDQDKGLVDPPQDKKPDGGPSSYYNLQEGWTTTNDIMLHKSKHQWKEHSWFIGNIFKSLMRWGDKDGTTTVYDARKIIYFGSWLLLMLTSKAELRKYLQELLDDKQFK